MSMLIYIITLYMHPEFIHGAKHLILSLIAELAQFPRLILLLAQVSSTRY